MASAARSNFNLCMFEDEFIRIGKLVSKIPYAETGGNLFGLWTNYGNAVVLVATGPGQNCKRTSVSFYQDIPYMTRVGNMLTKGYPLCHIGEWHSHHQMHLYEPSAGDCSTVQRNYPEGSQGFVLMIANILSNGTVKLSPYKFVDERSPFQHGKIEVFTGETPFRQVSRIRQCIEEGMEIHTAAPTRLLDRETNSCDNEIERSGQTESRKREERFRSRSRLGNPKTTTDNHTSPRKRKFDKSPDQHSNPTFYTPHPPRQPKSERRSNRAKRPSQYSLQPPRAASRNSQTAIANCNQETNNRPRMDIQAERSPERNTRVNMDMDVIEENPWYITYQQVAKEMRDFFIRLSGHDSNEVKMSRNPNTKNMSMEFEFHGRFIAVEFPSEFPYGIIKVLQKQYRTQSLSDFQFSYITCISASTNLQIIQNDLERKLRSICRCQVCMYLH